MKSLSVLVPNSGFSPWCFTNCYLVHEIHNTTCKQYIKISLIHLTSHSVRKNILSSTFAQSTSAVVMKKRKINDYCHPEIRTECRNEYMDRDIGDVVYVRVANDQNSKRVCHVKKIFKSHY